MSYIHIMNVAHRFTPVFITFLLTTCFMICLQHKSCGQELVSPQGGYFENEVATLSYSIGEVLANTSVGTDNLLNEGFQQSDPLAEFIKLGVNELEIQTTIYPNPFSYYIQVNTPQLLHQTLRFELYHISGHHMDSGILRINESSITTTDYPSGGYILTITDPQTDISISQLIIKK